MASRTVSKARIVLKDLAQDAICEALITVAAHVARFDMKHPRVREFCEGVYAGYSWGMALCPPFRRAQKPERDPSWEAVQTRTAQRAAELGIKVVS